MALRSEMVDLIGSDPVDEPGQVQRVGKIAVVQEQTHAVEVRPTEPVEGNTIQRPVAVCNYLFRSLTMPSYPFINEVIIWR